MMRRFLFLFVVCWLAGVSAFGQDAANSAADAGVGMEMLAVLSRWVHVITAVLLLGGSFFLRFVLMPSANEVLDDEVHARLRPVLMKRWKRVVHGCIGLLLLSGFYNYLVVLGPTHSGQALYHALLGVKIILAFIIFGLVSLLVSTREKPNFARRNSLLWSSVSIGLGIVVVLLAGYVKAAL